MVQIGARIRALRNAQKMTQDQLAEKLHVTRQAVSNWETGKTEPDLAGIQRLAEIFDTDATALLSQTECEAQGRRFSRMGMLRAGILGGIVLILFWAATAFRTMAMQYRRDTFDIKYLVLYWYTVLPALYVFLGVELAALLALVANIKISSRNVKNGILAAAAAWLLAYYLLYVLCFYVFCAPEGPGWMLPARISSSLWMYSVQHPALLIVPGIGLFYGFSARKKDISSRAE